MPTSPSTGPSGRRGPARRFANLGLAVLTLIVLLAGLEGFARWQMVSRGWHDTWEYLTLGDPTTGFALRPEIQTRWTGTDVIVNRSGVRDVRTDAILEPKREGELLVLVTGDSNTFGNGVVARDTYAGRLEELLAKRLPGPVRVVNLGVPGFSSVQSRLRLERWMHLRPDVVVFADCFNDRAYSGLVESEGELAGWHRRYRQYEVGGRILYSLLYLLGGEVDEEADRRMALDQPLPDPRVPLPLHRENLERVATLCEEHGARLVFTGTGDDPAVGGLIDDVLASAAAGEWGEAASRARRLTKIRPAWFLNWFRYAEAVRQVHGSDEFDEVAADHASSALPDYMNQFVSYAAPYLEQMGDIARERGVEFVDVRPALAEHEVRFVDVCHYRAGGHVIVARAIAERLLQGSADRRGATGS